MLKKAFYTLTITIGVVLCLLTSCQKEERYGTDLGGIEFSCDTIAFDTVFVQMGTTTRQFKVYNRGGEAVMLAISVQLRTLLIAMLMSST